MELLEYKRNYEFENDYWWFRGVRAMIALLLEQNYPDLKIGKTLDLGCGTGANLDLLKNYTDDLWGVDISAEALNYCRLRGHKNLIQADAAKLPFDDSTFDTVVTIGVIEHLDDDNRFLAEIYRVLKPGGTVILLTSSFQFLWSAHDIANHHKKRYTINELETKISSHGFHQIKLSHLNFLLFLPIALILIGHRLVFGLEQKNPKRMLPKVNPFTNSILTLLLKIESQLMRKVVLPFGISMIGSFKKKSKNESDWNDYNQWNERNEDMRKFWLNKLKDHLSKKSDNQKNLEILDYGCGHFDLGLSMASRCHRFDGFDPYSAPLEELQKNELLPENSTLFSKTSEIPHGKYDSIILNSVLQYFQNREELRAFLKNARTYLKQNSSAQILITDIIPPSYSAPIDAIENLIVAIKNGFASPMFTHLFKAAVRSDRLSHFQIEPQELEKIVQEHGFFLVLLPENLTPSKRRYSVVLSKLKPTE